MAIYRGNGETGTGGVSDIAELAQEAAASAEAAEAAQLAAETAETNAELAETNAETAATNAASSASSASTSATNAASSATAASNSASTATTQATNAANSATAAATSASNASTSATNAANSATSASTSASTATTQATNAANSATAAASSTSSASTSATNAASSASTATTQATNAANSATAAATSATNASNSASAAATSATNAANSATSASTSAANAANSATQAANSAASAAAIVTGVASNRPSIRPSLLLDFSNTKQLDPRVTFSRASTATYYDGKTVTKAEENLLINSNNNASAWAVVASSLTSAQPDPFGTSLAYLMTADGTSGTHNIQTTTVSFNASTVYTTSIFAKAGTNNFIQLRMTSAIGAPYANFDLSTGTAGNTNCTASISAVGSGGWYRCAISYTASATASAAFGVFIASSNTAASAETNSLATTILWTGVQIEQRSTATAYTPTTTAPITNYIPALQTAVSNDARFDHDPVTGESKGLLIEEQRTNLWVRSDDFANASWTKVRGTITSNTIIAPDGTLTGDKFSPDTSVNTHLFRQDVSVISGTAYTWTIYAKAAELNSINLEFGPDNSAFALTAGTFTLTGSGSVSGSGSITSVGNGWYRCSLTATATATATGVLRYYVGGSVAGNDFNGIYVWGAQLEAGSFPTSYIPTVASQVTRSADSASMTGSNFSSWYRADEGSIYADYRSFANTAYPDVFNLSNSTNSNRVNQFIDASNGYTTFREIVNNTQQGLASQNSTQGTAVKSAGGYYSAGVVFDLNGASVVTGNNLTHASGLNKLSIGSNVPATGSFLNGTIKRIAYYPKRLSNTELQGLTS